MWSDGGPGFDSRHLHTPGEPPPTPSAGALCCRDPRSAADPWPPVGRAGGTLGAVTPLTRGENRPLSGDQVTVAVTGPPVDVSALLLGASGQVRGDRDLVFFNSPVGDGVTLHHGRGRGDAVQVDLRAVPDDVGTVVVTASLDGTGPATFGQAGPLVATVGPETFEIAGLGSESAEERSTNNSAASARVCCIATLARARSISPTATLAPWVPRVSSLATTSTRTRSRLWASLAPSRRGP